jgi:hypothetical protein
MKHVDKSIDRPTSVSRVTNLADKRSIERVPALRSADVILGDGRAPVACLVKDISNSGLRLLINTPHPLPRRFIVVLHHPRIEKYCELVWQSANEIGLRVVESV